MAREIPIIEKLNPAKFRNVPFLVPEETVERGQKIALHEYPNSDKRFAEPLGKIPPDIDLVGIVHGEFYFEDRESLETALEKPGIGELVHPIYGPIDVQAGKFTVKSTQRRVGEFVFNMKFYVSTEVQPNPLPPTGLTAFAAGGLAFGDLMNGIEDLYQAPSDSFSLFDAVDTMLSVLDTINDAIDSIVNPIEEFAAKIKTAIAQFRNGIYRIMQTAAGLKENLLNVYNSFVQLVEDVQTLSEAWDKLIDFSRPGSVSTDGATISVPIKQTSITPQRENKSINNTIITEQVKLFGLIGSFQSAANSDFDTTEDLQEKSDALEETFNSFFQSDAISSTGTTGKVTKEGIPIIDKIGDNPQGVLINDPDFKESMLKLRVVSKEALDDQKSKTWKVIDINPGRTSLALTTYRYYGSLDNVDILTELNPSVHVSNFQEQINAVTI